MSINTSGSGYNYLTRQVAALDSTEKGHTAASCDELLHHQVEEQINSRP
jgi:hypothetical protein